MITPADIRDFLTRRPFEPIRICLSDGRSFVVRHPDMCMVGRNTIQVGIPDPEDERLYARVAQCAILHITGIEPVNGKKSKTSKKRREGGH